MLVVVMGVCGAGKSTVARALARALPARFVDADDSPASTHGDEDEALLRLCERVRAVDDRDVVVACAALRRRQRDALRDRIGDMRLVYLHPSLPTLACRRPSRCDAHDVLAQLRRLEPPDPEERAISITNEDPVETVAARILSALVLELEPAVGEGPRARH